MSAEDTGEPSQKKRKLPPSDNDVQKELREIKKGEKKEPSKDDDTDSETVWKRQNSSMI